MSLVAAALVLAGGLLILKNRNADPQPELHPDTPRAGAGPIPRALVDRVLPWQAPVARLLTPESRLSMVLVLAVIARESSGDPAARNAENKTDPDDDSVGLMQVTKGAISDYNSANGTRYTLEMVADDPEKQLRVGMWYLNRWTTLRGSVYEGLRAYNAGPGAAARDPKAAQNYARWIIDRAVPPIAEAVAV